MEICTNFEICRLVKADDYKIDNEAKDGYIQHFCNATANKWKRCKRYIIREELGFCPDFVLPDTLLSPLEIVERFDEDDSLL